MTRRIGALLLVAVSVLVALAAPSAGATRHAASVLVVAAPGAGLDRIYRVRPGATHAPLSSASPTATSANSTTYQDSVGENPAAPDITTITVSNTDASMLSFRVNVPNRPTLDQGTIVEIWVDSDNTTTTGSPDLGGVDYVMQLALGEINLYRWDGSDFTRRFGDPSAVTLTYSYQGGVTVRISAAELGNTKRFAFFADVITGCTVDPATQALDCTVALDDIAPGTGFYQYDVRVGSPPPPNPPPPMGGRTYEDAGHLPSRIRYVGTSIKHVRLGEKLYSTMKRLGIPRVVAIACWSKADWPSVLRSVGAKAQDRIDGFWLSYQSRWVHLSPKQCSDVQGLMSDRQPNGQRAYALSTVLHERIHAQDIPIEAQAECYSVQLVYEFARELNFVPAKAVRLMELAVRKSNATFTGTRYRDPRRCRDGGAWDLYPGFPNL